MSDEQVIYLGPEEDLTDVRQRLEQAPAERLILVVPPQTKLRSHVGWRLLHARTRELGKQVLVVSSDRQIRAVVKVAGFKVAESLTAPPSSRPRPGSRPGRLAHGARSSSRNLAPRQRSEQARTPSSAETRSAEPPHAPGGLSTQPGRTPPARSAEPYIEDLSSATGLFAPSFSEPDIELQPPARPQTARPGSPSYDFPVEPIDATPAVSPASPFISPDREEEPEDMLLEDFQTAQRIRQAAREGPGRRPSGLDRQAYRTSPLREDAAAAPPDEDPFSRIEEIAVSPLPEQHGSFAPLDEFEEEIPPIAGRPPQGAAVEAEVEDLGDQGDFVLPSTRPSQAWSSTGRRERPEDREQDVDRSPATVGPQTHLDPLTALPEGRRAPTFADRELEEALPAIDAMPTNVLPGRPQPPRVVSGSLAGGPSSSSPRVSREAAPSRSTSARPDRRPAVSRAAAGTPHAAARGRSHLRSTLLFVVSLVIVLILLGAVAYYAPSADVTFTLPAHTFSQTLRFTANASSRLDLSAHTVPAQQMTVSFSAQDQGRASGVTQVGLVKAHGTVLFTNKSARSLVIPTGTIVATPDGVQFRTTAEPLITPGATYPVQIEAVNAGTAGNVPANTITVIPPASLQQIGAASGDLTVTNPQPTSGGGVGSAPQVTAADASAVQSTLHARLQQQLQAWLTRHTQAGDVPGKPQQQETFKTSPAVGQAAPQGTFSATLTLQTTVLLIRASDLQAAAAAALKAAISGQQRGYTLLAQEPLSISGLKSTPSNDGQSITVVFTATGLVAPAISDQDIQHLLVGKPKDQALRDLGTLLATRLGKPSISIQTAINVNPGFYPWMPLIEDHIHIHKNIVTT